MEKSMKKFYWENRGVFCVLCLVITFYFILRCFTGFWPTSQNPYNSYVLQASSWLQGRLDLGQNYTYLELAVLNGKYFVSFPPFPSMLLLPFVAVFGTDVKDGILAVVSTLVGAVYVYRLIKHYVENENYCILLATFVMIGQNLVFVSVNSYVWFIAQNLCFTFSVMAVYYAVKGKSLVSFLLWAFSIGCRPFQVVYFPLLLLLMYQREKEVEQKVEFIGWMKKLLIALIPTIVVAIIYMSLNYARFGSITEFGHNFLPEHLNSEKGQFSIDYIFANFPKLFYIPEFGENGIWQIPKFNGMNVFLVIPIYAYFVIEFVRYIVREKKIDGILVLYVALAIIHIISILAHNTLGGWHFGNRYFIDLVPFMLGMILYVLPKKMRISIPLLVLTVLGVSMNLLGTVIIYNDWLA